MRLGEPKGGGWDAIEPKAGGAPNPAADPKEGAEKERELITSSRLSIRNNTIYCIK